MRQEIGSHFELDNEIIKETGNDDWLPKGSDFTYTFSGRAAIELAIRDIKKRNEIKCVYLPSYCCDSMVTPFINCGINIEYYNVSYDRYGINYDLDYNTKCDVFFAMSYFGLEDREQLDAMIEAFLNRGKIVIEDITHRLLCRDSHSNKVHYSIASIRKWFSIPTGGCIIKNRGKLDYKPYKQSDHLVINRLNAMKDKYRYLQGDNIKKETFLMEFTDFERKLATLSKDYTIDEYSLNMIEKINLDTLRTQRRKNAKTLYEGLKLLKTIRPLIPSPQFNNACPLFVPVIVSQGKRDDLRNYLIKNDVYCPIHWPKKEIGIDSKIPDAELSLICDHRYNARDMEYVLSLIMKWEK